MKEEQPFSLYLRKKVYFVRFKKENGGYTTGRSTKETTKSKAIQKAWKMLTSPETEKQKSLSELSTVLKKVDLSREQAKDILDYIQKQGLIKSYILTGSKKDVNALEYVLDFWNPEKSKHLKEQARANKIHYSTQVLKGHIGNIQRYWTDILKDKVLADLTKSDLDLCLDRISDLDLSFNTKNKIMECVTKPLGYAYKQDLIDVDISKKWVRFTGHNAKREIFTDEIIQALINKNWHDIRAKIAFMLSITTGMRVGEILALRIQDIDAERKRIYVNHSWSRFDGLKTTKNGDKRIAVCPFEYVFNQLENLYSCNPHDIPDDEKWIFWGNLKDKPIDEKTFIKGLRHELQELGMTEEEVFKYVFHSCRHTFITKMTHSGSSLNAVQANVGHKTAEMTEHYSNHAVEAERVQFANDVAEQFGKYFTPSVVNL